MLCWEVEANRVRGGLLLRALCIHVGPYQCRTSGPVAQWHTVTEAE
jgi:hypothetical protein